MTTSSEKLEQYTSLARGVLRIWLVRHGQTAWNEQGRFCGHIDIPLSPIGRRQARKLASQLQHRPIASIYSSDLSRARETAEIIGAKIVYKNDRETTNDNMDDSRESARVSPTYKPTIKLSSITFSPAWREMNFGVWEGLTYAEIASSFPDQLGFFTDPEHATSPQGGEMLTDVLQRIHPALYEMVQRTHSGEVVLVSHGGVLRVLLCSLLGMPIRNQWQLHIDTGSLSAIDVSMDEHGELLASLVGLNGNRCTPAPNKQRRLHPHA